VTSQLRATLNDALRAVIDGFIGVLAAGGALLLALRIRRWPRAQSRLRRRLGVTRATPILRYGSEIEQLIAARAQSAPARDSAEFALTSGSTCAPKRIWISRARLRLLRWLFVDAYCRACRAFGLRRRSLFILASISDDDSLTAKMMRESGRVPALALLQAPYRALADPIVQAWAAELGSTAVRVLLLTLANPGVIYATNPSTLATFLDDVVTDWPKVRQLAARAADLAQGRAASNPRAQRSLVHRLLSQGAGQRLAAVADSAQPLPLSAFAPAVAAIMTWTGGYVAPFLERVRQHLPATAYRLIPMYSMSTETVETLPVFARHDGAAPAFLPVAPGVLYEFLPAGRPDDPAELVPAWALMPGDLYALVVSDAHGLRRYQTEDLFVCRRLLRGLPDLAFVRRRGLAHSFTGEKLTGEQIEAAFARLRQSCGLPADVHLTLQPRFPPTDALPHYHLHVVGAAPGLVDLDRIARECHALLGDQNSEYRGKSASGRLGPVQAGSLDAAAFARTITGSAQGAPASWEAQFKFLPLTLARQ
jgi:hypothetical protein